MDQLYDLTKYRNIQLSYDTDAILFFHHYQKLIYDSRQPEGLDPFPVKQIGNFKVLIEALSQMFKSLGNAIVSLGKIRR